jgi:flagellar assembly factor FliW
MTTIATTTKIRERLLSLTNGLLGFEDLKQFSLSVYDPNTPFYWLKSLEDKELQFIVIEPQYVVEDYIFDISDEDAKEIDINDPKKVFVLVVVCIPEDPSKMTVNLMGPLVFNSETGLGKQIVLHGSNFPIQFPLFPEGIPGVSEEDIQEIIQREKVILEKEGNND